LERGKSLEAAENLRQQSSWQACRER